MSVAKRKGGGKTQKAEDLRLSGRTRSSGRYAQCTVYTYVPRGDGDLFFDGLDKQRCCTYCLLRSVEHCLGCVFFRLGGESQEKLHRKKRATVKITMLTQGPHKSFSTTLRCVNVRQRKFLMR